MCLAVVSKFNINASLISILAPSIIGYIIRLLVL